MIRALGQAGHTILLSSHLMGEVEQVCDRVGIIAQGRLLTASSVSDLRGQGRILARAEDLDRAQAVLFGAFGPARVHRVDGALEIDGTADDVSAVNQTLVSHGVAVTEIRRVERSLEQVFLEMTTGHTEEVPDGAR